MSCAFVAGLEVPTPKLVLSVVVIAGGVAVASYGAVDYNVQGVVIIVLSFVADAIRLIMTQMLLQEHKFNASTRMCLPLLQHLMFNLTHSGGLDVHSTCLCLLVGHQLNGI